jgi:hypothetical protein
MENVFLTTNERNEMSKLTFKRISLVLAGVLGFGVLNSGSSSATVVPSSDTLTVSANTATVSVGDTASVTLNMSFIAQNAGDSLSVVVVNQSAPSAATTATKHALYITDSANASIHTTAQTCATGIPATNTVASVNCAPDTQKDYGPRGATGGVAPSNYSATVAGYVGTTSASGGSLAASFAWRLSSVDAAGTYVFRAYLVAGTGTSYTIVSVPQTITITATANTSTVASEAYSLAYINQPAAYTGSTGYAADASARAYKALEADSALVVSAGVAATPAIVGVMHFVVKNASDTKVASVTNTDGSAGTLANMRVKDSITVVISGPGTIAVHNYWSGTVGTAAKQVKLDWKETLVVYSDGTAGVGTITSYVGGSVAAAGKFTQAAKTVTFTGRATTFTVSAGSIEGRAGSTIAYKGAADSITAAAATIRFLAKDAAGNAVTSAALSTQPGDSTQNNSTFWAISSDTAVLAANEAGATFATSADRRSPALPCTYDAATAYWTCTGRVFDTGTVTLTVVDSRTVSGSSVLTTTTSAVYKSDAFSVTFAGAGNTGTVSLGKTTFNINEAFTASLTCKDGSGRNVADGTSGTCWTNLNWSGAAPTFGLNSSVNAAGGKFTALETYMTTGGSYNASWVAGVDTALAFMPTTAGTYTLNGRTAGATVDSVILTFTVVDPNAAATLAAAEAATDAAAEAIDAANAATDAANLAAEAADAATVAAEEARDAADAATAAVEELATQVATLMAALKAQITTLANTVAKIAKKVAKL